MTQECDNASVGVIIRNQQSQLALLKRGNFPMGIAPPAGHVDQHGSPEQAALDEVNEELGVSLTMGGLSRTIIRNRRVDNVCRRANGDHHIWNVYEAHVTEAKLQPDPEETAGADWYEPEVVQDLADRTRAYQQGEISEQDWAANPGLEEVWLGFFVELGYVQ